MRAIRVGLVADPASPTVVARRWGDLNLPRDGERAAWDVELVSESARDQGWDVVVGVTELPLSDDDSSEARERSRLYNSSTMLTLTAGVLMCYVVLFVVNLLWALFVLDPDVMGSSINSSLAHGDMVLLAWFVASAAYSKREEERRNRLAREQA